MSVHLGKGCFSLEPRGATEAATKFENSGWPRAVSGQLAAIGLSIKHCERKPLSFQFLRNFSAFCGEVTDKEFV
jgi:hypothetical protein